MIKKLTIAAILLPVICAIGGYLEHGTYGGAWSVVWLVPVVYGLIYYTDQREAVNKEYEQKKQDWKEDKRRIAHELRYYP